MTKFPAGGPREPMRLGFTGSQQGMTRHQKLHLPLIFSQATSFTHGDCIGADAEAALIADMMGLPTIAHPCNIDAKRANYPSTLVLPAKPPLYRNVDIVLSCDMLVAAPHNAIERQRSGTWYTIRKALFYGRKMIVLFPDGRFEVYSGRNH